MTVNAYLWGLVGMEGETRAFLVAGDILIHLHRSSSVARVEGYPIMAASHESAVQMALGMTEEAEGRGMVLGTRAHVMEIPDHQPAHLYSAQSISGIPLSPPVRALLDRMKIDGIVVKMNDLT
jgi:hypothetical protein